MFDWIVVFLIYAIVLAWGFVIGYRRSERNHDPIRIMPYSYRCPEHGFTFRSSEPHEAARIAMKHEEEMHGDH